ncbi:OLC1v1030987C1 [Oldenlandia corymbosa var. corymbosa]|uniref:OLC1v1030987C1 n=1 Tax=Oldenlandia corymbosa var. corymbosa TaxID=529605 RepID=A0AAV1CJB0_OLDCO|nr:OLC1v1030987C1 [Oldenlandia corymbosa var. corymbosa]
MEWLIRTRYKACVDHAEYMLKILLDDRNLSRCPTRLKNTIRARNFELRCIQMFFWGLGFPKELFEDHELMLRFTFMAQELRRTTKAIQIQFQSALGGGNSTVWEAFNLLQSAIRSYKSRIREMCFLLLAGDGAFKCEFSSFQLVVSSHEYGDETVDFMSLIKRNLGVLVPYLPHPVTRQQFVLLRRKLKLFRRFVSILALWRHRSRGTDELMYHIQAWASHISCLACLYWIDGMDHESLGSALSGTLSELMQKVVPYNPGNIVLFLDVFKAAKYHRLQGTKLPSLLADFVDFLLENYVNDDVETLREGLTFLFSFVMDSPNEGSAETQLILAEIYAVVEELPPTVCILESSMLSSFLHKIERILTNARESFDVSTLSSQFHSPKTNYNEKGFLDSLLETMQNMLRGDVDFIPSVKNKVIQVYEGLSSLRPLLQRLQNDDPSGFEGLWTKIVNLTHYTAYVTKLCPITSFSVWYGIVCLPNVIRDIKLVNYEFEKITDHIHMYSDNRVTLDQMDSSDSIVSRVTTSIHEENFIGFTETVASIVDNLLGGRADLTIISISGMPGQGKTTLARQLCNHLSIKHHFHKIKWCFVTKEYKIREMLANMWRGDDNDHDYSNFEVHYLADQLWKSLKGKRYFIVLDDIWDADVWFQVKHSFPDDKKGSRILFTSRNRDLAIQCKQYSISHHLRLFSDEESLELMKNKLSFTDGFPTQLEGVARQIASDCKGLPLAVVLVASHLKTKSPELGLWEEVAENLKSHLADEGCMDIIELSYKHLPHHLKPCFLYFGIFQRGQNINANTLTCLWIAEGFIKKNEVHSSQYYLAREYLEYLVSQNLIIATGRSSTGKIRSCVVHDLLHDLCLRKVMEGNLLHLVDYNTVLDNSHHSSPLKYKYHHHWLCMRDKDPDFTYLTSNSSRKDLPMSEVHSLLMLSRDLVPVHHKFLSQFLSCFGALTILEMTLLHLKCDAIPEVIFYNIHLRYLSLRGSFSHVPKSIANLWNLETLKLYAAEYYLRLPKCFWGIKSLLSVRIRILLLQSDDFGENMSATVAASKIESLRGITLRYDCKTIEFLGGLSSLRRLRCSFDEGFRPEWLSMFESLGKLESLSIANRIEVNPNHGWRNLNINFPTNLKKLSLWYIGLPWSAMSMIGKLPHLETLRLYFNACKGTTWILGDGEFSKLKYLKVYRMNVKQIINDSDDYDNPPFSCLEKLLVYYCKRLEEIPPSLADIFTLNSIHLIASPKASGSATAIVEQQQDTGNFDLELVVLDHDINYDIYYDEKDEVNYEEEEEDGEDREDEDEHHDDDENNQSNDDGNERPRKRRLVIGI